MDRRHVLIGGGGIVALGVGAAWLGTAGMGSSADYANAARAMRAALAAQPNALDLIRFATLAPNSHNTQGWQFAVEPAQITIRPDFSRRTPAVDPDDHHLYISLGCACENLVLAAATRGQLAETVVDASTDGAIAVNLHAAAPEPSPLVDAIPLRQSTRAVYDGRSVRAAMLHLLAEAGRSDDVELMLITDRPMINRIRDLVVAGNSAQMADPAFVRELKTWLRFNPRQALRSGDGLYSVASGNPALPDWLGPVAFDWLSTPASQNDAYARQINTSAGVAVFVGVGETPAHWVAVGRACQRFALQATALGLKTAFINQPVEVPTLRPQLAALIGASGRRPDIVMRFGYGPIMPYSPRRPVASVIAV